MIGYGITYWPNTQLIKSTRMVDFDDLNEGEVFLSIEDGPPGDPVPAPLTPADILASQSAKLQGLTSECNAQKAALTNRISTIQDAIEYEIATPEEEAELPVRQAQLKAWKLYGVALGRVTTVPAGAWPADPVWPAKPAAGMDLTVSASAPETA